MNNGAGGGVVGGGALLEAARPVVHSLEDLAWGEDKGERLEDRMPDTSTPVVLDTLVARDVRGKLLELLECLPQRERDILLQRFGFVDGTVHSLADIARGLNLTHQRIGHIVLRALKRLREPQRRAKLKHLLSPT